MPWLESHADLRDHPKTDLLMDLLAITRRDAVGLLHLVWWRALTYAPSGDLADFTDGQLARWAEWDGDPGHLVSGLKTAGFLDVDRRLHDWDEYAGRWIDRREADATRKRQARAAAAGRSNGVSPGTSGARPPGRRAPSGVPDLTGPDRTLTGPDTTTTPQPPPAEGEQMQPVTTEDIELWQRVCDRLRAEMKAGNVEQLIVPLVPLGRGPDGGLRLSAPPGQSIARRVSTLVTRALLDEGDAAAKHVAIVER